MAVNPHDVGITRDQVKVWIDNYNRSVESLTNFDESLRDYLLKQLAKKGHDSTVVDTTGHENLGDSEPLIDMILADLDSYV